MKDELQERKMKRQVKVLARDNPLRVPRLHGFEGFP